MTDAFVNVEIRLLEADFFLDKIRDCNNLTEAGYYLNAFINAARSVTWALKKTMHKVSGFEEWYQSHEANLGKDEIAKFFVSARNASQKEGVTHINIGKFSGGKTEYLFSDFSNGDTHNMIVEGTKYLTSLLEIILDCFQKFRYEIDPHCYYSIDNMNKRGETVKQLELELWGYPKWSSFGLSDNEIHGYIMLNMLVSPVEPLFIKYLSKTKNGDSVIA